MDKNNQLNGLRVAILATDGFEQSELFEPKKALEEAGAKVTVVGLETGAIRGWKDTDWGAEIAVDLTVEQARAEDFDALQLPGGVMNPDKLRTHERAVALIRAFADAGKPIGAICHAPWTLIEAGVVRGREMTSWPSLRTDLENAGARWVDRETVVDRGLVTSRRPDDIPAFNAALIEEIRKNAFLYTKLSV